MIKDLTTYQIYLMLLGYLIEQEDTTKKFRMLGSMLFELYKRADKANSSLGPSTDLRPSTEHISFE